MPTWEIELRAGRSIAQIFADDGEEAFRELESRVLAESVRRERTVLALGGGVVLRPENRALLKGIGLVVWLEARPETIHRRLADDETSTARRPPLTTGGLAEIRELLDRRTPHYRECASLVVDTEDKMPSEVAEEILSHVSRSADPP